MSTATKLATNNDLYHTKILAQMTIDAIKANKATEAIANLDGLVNFVSQFPCDAALGEPAVETPTSPATEPKPAELTPEVRHALEDISGHMQHLLDHAGEADDLLDKLLHPELFEEVEPDKPITNPVILKVHERGTAVIASLDHEQLSALADLSGSFIANAVVKECKSRGIEVYEE
jgi:hypothetical protein